MKKILAIAAAALSALVVSAADIKPQMVDMKGLKPTKELTILKASYGIKGKNKDVTEIVKKEIKAGKNIVPSNQLFKGDPAPNKAKRLEIVYSVNGTFKMIAVYEGATVKAASIK